MLIPNGFLLCLTDGCDVATLRRLTPRIVIVHRFSPKRTAVSHLERPPPELCHFG